MRPAVEQELVRHAAALRTLAAALVGEPAADDLVQDAAVEALRSPPVRPGPLGGWLAQIVRHLASRHRRSERRRRERERRAAHAEAVAGDHSVEDRDLLRALTDAVLDLPEPYRATILQRYLRDRSLGAIAAEAGIPTETVKSRHRRGLALLRARLAQQSGRDWRLAVTAAFGLDEAVTTTATTATSLMGVLLVKTATKGLFCGVLAAVSLIAVLLWQRSGDLAAQPAAGPTSAPAAMVADAGEPTAPAHRPDDLAASPGVRRALPDAERPAVIRGRCIDGDDRPLGDCSIRLAAQAGAGDPVATSSAVDGTFEISLAAGGTAASLRLECAGHRAQRHSLAGLTPGRIVELGDLRMERVREVRLRTVDSGGRPVPRAFVRLGVETVRTDDLGRASLLAPTGWMNVYAVPPATVERLGVEDGTGPAELVVPLSTAVPHIDGFVVDEHGQPVDVATLAASEEAQSLGSTSTGANGMFALARGPAATGDRFTLRVTAPGFEPVTLDSVTWDTHGLQVRLRAGAAIELHVRRADGSPVEEFEAWVHPIAEGGSHEAGTRAAGRFPGGVARVVGVRRGPAHASVRAADPLLGVRVLVDCTVGEDRPPLEIVLPGIVERTLRVEQEGGAPVPGAQVELLATVLGRRPQLRSSAAPFDGRWIEHWDASGWRDAPSSALRVQRTSTDASGVAVLRGPVGEELTLRLLSTEDRLVPVDLTIADPLVVTLPASGTVRGRIADAEIARRVAALGGPAGSSDRGAVLVSLRAAADVAPGGRRSFQARIGAAGTYEIPGVPPGSWTVQLQLQMPPLMRRLELGTVAVRAGEIVERDLDLGADVPAELRATILVDGEPSASGQILLLGGNGFGDVATVQRRVDENGIFQASALPGTYRALLAVEPSGTFGSLEATDPLVIPPGGELAPTLHFVSGRARLRICDAAGDPVVGLQLEVATPNGALKTTAATDAAGGTGFRCAPGTYRVFAWRSDLQTRDARDAFRKEHSPEELDAARFELGVLDLPAGAIVERELRLPAAWRR